MHMRCFWIYLMTSFNLIGLEHTNSTQTNITHTDTKKKEKKSKISNTNSSLVPHFWAYKKWYEELENGHHKLFNDTSFLLNRDLKGQNVSLHKERTYDFKLGGRSIRKEKKKPNRYPYSINKLSTKINTENNCFLLY